MNKLKLEHEHGYNIKFEDTVSPNGTKKVGVCIQSLLGQGSITLNESEIDNVIKWLNEWINKPNEYLMTHAPQQDNW